ncbi:MAG: hypothetical protein JWM88_1566, partial [Verrucomicrobia bacterium]|nr:hypothetical protein [Verrucomicrobiota bacterium]
DEASVSGGVHVLECPVAIMFALDKKT